MRKKLSWFLNILVLFGMLAMPASAFAAAARILGSHTVKTGETLYCIGRAYGVDPAAIAKENKITNMNRLTVGQKLAIPDAAWINMPAGKACQRQFEVKPVPACSEMYTVRWGDSLSKIARRYGLTVADLLKVNKIANANWIFPGQTLCIP